MRTRRQGSTPRPKGRHRIEPAGLARGIHAGDERDPGENQGNLHGRQRIGPGGFEQQGGNHAAKRQRTHQAPSPSDRCSRPCRSTNHSRRAAPRRPPLAYRFSSVRGSPRTPSPRRGRSRRAARRWRRAPRTSGERARAPLRALRPAMIASWRSWSAAAGQGERIQWRCSARSLPYVARAPSCLGGSIVLPPSRRPTGG